MQKQSIKACKLSPTYMHFTNKKCWEKSSNSIASSGTPIISLEYNFQPTKNNCILFMAVHTTST